MFILDNHNFNILIYSTPTLIDRIDAVEGFGTAMASKFIAFNEMNLKLATIRNMKVTSHGEFFYSTDPIQLIAEYIDIDMDKTSMGYHMWMECNYPEAATTGQVIFRH